jgi:hypothetical protein
MIYACISNTMYIAGICIALLTYSIGGALLDRRRRGRVDPWKS